MSQKMLGGKISMWSFVMFKPAKNCKNRSKGIIVIKSIASVNRDTIKEIVLRNLIIPAIKRRIHLVRKNHTL